METPTPIHKIYNSQMHRYLSSDGYNIFEHTASVVPHPGLLTLEQECLWSSLAGILNWEDEKGVIHTAVQNSFRLPDATQMYRLQNLLQFQEQS